MPVNASLAQ
jgi:hypothetical protein